MKVSVRRFGLIEPISLLRLRTSLRVRQEHIYYSGVDVRSRIVMRARSIVLSMLSVIAERYVSL